MVSKPLIFYILEFCFLVFILFSGISMVDTYHKEQQLENEIAYKNSLNTLVIEVIVEATSASNQSIRHYDRYSQKKRQIDQLLMIGRSEDLAFLNEQVDLLISDVDHYLQLISMLKTSMRYISHFNIMKKNTDTKERLILNTSMLVAAYVNSVYENQRETIKSGIEKNILSIEAIGEDNLINVYLSHVNFIMEKWALSEDLLVPIKKAKVYAFLNQDLITLRKELADLVWLITMKSIFFVLMISIMIISVFIRQSMILRHANKMANAAVEVKSQFLANMSHEIRTPMNGMLGFTDLLLSTHLSDTQQSYVNNVKFSIKSLSTVIDDILDYSRMESNRLKVELKPFNLYELMDNIRATFIEAVSKKDLEFLIDLDTRLKNTYVGDPVRLSQVIMNLMSNAVKFTDHGRVILKIEVMSEEVQGVEKLLFSVSDTGIGISESEQKLLFQRFFQVDGNTHRKYGGTGLGLCICRMLVDLMGGGINLESKKGEGTSVTFTLDFSVKEESDAPLRKNAFEGASILILEDSSVTYEALLKMTDYFGLTADKANSLVSAETLLSRQHYDFVLVDIPSGSDDQAYFSLLSKQVNTSQVIRLFDCFSSLSGLSGSYKKLAKPVLMNEFYDTLANIGLNNETINKPEPQVEDNLTNSSSVDKEAFAEEETMVEKETVEGVANRTRVLIAEDQEVNIMLMECIFEDLDVDFTIVTNGKLAIDQIKENSFDIILMDIQMPEMDGVAATEIIRKQYSMTELPVYAVTANVMASDRERYEQVGMNGCIAKPFEVDDIIELLESFKTDGYKKQA